MNEPMTQTFQEAISLNEAASKGIERLRHPAWSTPMDHVQISIVDGKPAPWLRLYSPMNMRIFDRDPVELLATLNDTSFDVRNMLPYTGPLPESEEYRAASAKALEATR